MMLVPQTAYMLAHVQENTTSLAEEEAITAYMMLCIGWERRAGRVALRIPPDYTDSSRSGRYWELGHL